MQEDDNLKDYDSEPVEYCAKCFSLAIKYEESLDSDCCSKCGCTEIKTATIDEWEKMYKKRYGHDFIDKHKDPRNSIYYDIPINELKVRLSKSVLLKKIFKDLYDSVPEGYTSLELTIILFDRLARDRRLDELKYELYLYANKDNF